MVNEGLSFDAMKDFVQKNTLESDLRIQFGNRYNRWYIVDVTDRDYETAFTQEAFVALQNENDGLYGQILFIK
jgi:hypothetical protein